MPERKRCSWPRTELDIHYHDEEWGVPVHDEARWFEFLTLEGAQAGLSWSTVLKKRENYRKAFANWNVRKIAAFTAASQRRLLGNEGLIRNCLKIESTITNARAFERVQEEFGSFDAYIWRFVDGKPVHNAFQELKEIP